MYFVIISYHIDVSYYKNANETFLYTVFSKVKIKNHVIDLSFIYLTHYIQQFFFDGCYLIPPQYKMYGTWTYKYFDSKNAP